jgi:hypothetical protein
MIKADLHNHLGSDGKNPGFDETIDLVYSNLGLGNNPSMFGIADSDDYRYERFVEQSGGRYDREGIEDSRAVYVPQKKVLVVKCQEMFTKEGHVLAIAMPYGKLLKTKNATDAIKAAKDLGGILCAVHPFYYQGIGNFLQGHSGLLRKFSTWEVYNGSAEFSFPKFLPKNANEESRLFYEEMRIPNLNIGMSSFTDGHSVKVIGTCYTELELKDNFMRENFIGKLDGALRNQKYSGKLHTEPNERDSQIHAVKMVLAKLKLRKD